MCPKSHCSKVVELRFEPEYGRSLPPWAVPDGTAPGHPVLPPLSSYPRLWPVPCSWGAFCGWRGTARLPTAGFIPLFAMGSPFLSLAPGELSDDLCPFPETSPWHRPFPLALMLSSHSLGHCTSWTCVRAASDSQQGNIQNKCTHQNTACIEYLLCVCSSPLA